MSSRVSVRRSPRLAGRQLGGKTFCELLEDLRRDHLDHASAEANDLPGQTDVRHDRDLTTATFQLVDRALHGQRDRTAAPLFQAFALHSDDPPLVVQLGELHSSLVVHGDRPELHLDPPCIVPLVNVFGELGSRQAQNEASRLSEEDPRLFRVRVELEALFDLESGHSGSSGSVVCVARAPPELSDDLSHDGRGDLSRCPRSDFETHGAVNPCESRIIEPGLPHSLKA